jgi:hypothetical protein
MVAASRLWDGGTLPTPQINAPQYPIHAGPGNGAGVMVLGGGTMHVDPSHSVFASPAVGHESEQPLSPSHVTPRGLRVTGFLACQNYMHS